MSWDDIVAVLSSQATTLRTRRYRTIPGGIRGMFAYFEAHTYFGPDADAKIALARRVSTQPFTDFASWAKTNMPAS